MVQIVVSDKKAKEKMRVEERKGSRTRISGIKSVFLFCLPSSELLLL